MTLKFRINLLQYPTYYADFLDFISHSRFQEDLRDLVLGVEVLLEGSVILGV